MREGCVSSPDGVVKLDSMVRNLTASSGTQTCGHRYVNREQIGTSRGNTY